MSHSPELRSQVARALDLVVERNRTIDWVAENHPKWLVQPLSRELLYGTLRHYFSLSKAVNARLDKPLRRKDQVVFYLMLVGAYQLKKLSLPDRVVVNETVEACRVLGKPWAKRLVNAVLRGLATNPHTEQSFEHPDWLEHKLKRQYAKQAEALLTANNQRAPMVVRVNQHRENILDYKHLLHRQDITWCSTPYDDALPEAMVLNQPRASATLPGWAEGKVAVQDLGAQAALFIWKTFVQHQHEPAGGDTVSVLDACVAPGGKLFHLLEYLSSQDKADDVTVLAIETSPARIDATQAIARRLGHAVNITRGDAGTLDWWDGCPFDHILLDAPCSGTGTLRRHPDIKVLLKSRHIPQHAQSQLELLNNLWRTLAPGGTLLYCTCSLLTEENDAVVQAFLAGNKLNDPSDSAAVVSIHLPTGQATRHGWQLTPVDSIHDGFYYALLQKKVRGAGTPQ